MIWSDIDFHPPERKLRIFAGLFCAATAALAVWQISAHYNLVLAALLLTSGAVVALLGILNPSTVRPL